MHHLPALGQTLGMLPLVMLFLIILQASQRDQIVTEQLHPLPKGRSATVTSGKQGDMQTVLSCLSPHFQPQDVSKAASHPQKLVYHFPMAAVIDYPKFGGLKQHTCILLQF